MPVDATTLSIPIVFVDVVLVGLLVAAAVVLSRIASRLMHRIWRAGYDVERKLAILLSGLRIGLLVLAVSTTTAIAWPWLRGAPVHLAALALGTVGLAGLPILQNVLAGVYLVARGDVREGDRVRVGATVGVVREMGLGRVRIREEDGTIALVPNRALIQESIGVLRSSGRATVSVQVDVSPQLSPRLLRQLVLLCPYRVVGTLVRVRQVGELWEVDLQTWRPGCHEEVESYLRFALEPYTQAGARRSPMPPGRESLVPSNPFARAPSSQK